MASPAGARVAHGLPVNNDFGDNEEPEPKPLALADPGYGFDIDGAFVRGAVRVTPLSALRRRWFKPTGKGVGCLGSLWGVLAAFLYMWVGMLTTITSGMWLAEALFGTYEFYAGFFIVPFIIAYLVGTFYLWGALLARRDRRNTLRADARTLRVGGKTWRRRDVAVTLDDNRLVIHEDGKQTSVFADPGRLAWFVEQLETHPELADGDKGDLPAELQRLRKERTAEP